MFRKVGERELWRGKLFSLAVGTYRDPGGGQFERELVRHPGAVSVVPVLADMTSVLLVRQYRPVIERELLEIPAGVRDVDGEAPEVTARRELEEEVGMRAGRLHKLAEFYPSAGFSDEYTYVFLGLDLEPCEATAHSVEEQHMTIETIALADVPRLVAAGAVTDAKTIIGLCLAREALEGGG